MRKTYITDAQMWARDMVTLAELKRRWKKDSNGAYSRLARALKEHIKQSS